MGEQSPTPAASASPVAPASLLHSESGPVSPFARDFNWTTSGPARDSIAKITELAANALVEAEIVDRSEGRYYAKWQRYGLGVLDLNCIEVAAQQVRHTPEMAARCPKESFDLVFMKRGIGKFRVSQQDVSLEEHTFVLMDNCAPYDLLFPLGTECLTIHAGGDWLRRWIAEPQRHSTRPISGRSGWGAPLASLMLTISELGVDTALMSRAEVASQLGGAFTLAFGDRRGHAACDANPVLARLRRLLQKFYFDPDLTPKAAAARIGISKRHLHTVFASAGTSFGAELSAVRLGKAAELLRRRPAHGLRIGDVAAACGFSDPSYFARCFRTRYGASPRSYPARED